MIKPKTNFISLPYSNSYTDIDKHKTILQIGNTDYYEDVFKNNNNYEYLETICELVPKYSFSNIEVTMKYRNEINETTNKEIKYNLYNNNFINMENVVSSIDVVLKNILNINKNISNNIIYTKNFIKQTKNIMVKTNEFFSESVIDTISNAYMFGGKFLPNNIQQYLFYIMHIYNEKPQIKIVSAEDVINDKNYIKLDPSIKLEDLSTLQDDIINGKITININNKKYQSVLLKKSTLISNRVNILFKLS